MLPCIRLADMTALKIGGWQGWEPRRIRGGRSRGGRRGKSVGVLKGWEVEEMDGNCAMVLDILQSKKE